MSSSTSVDDLEAASVDASSEAGMIARRVHVATDVASDFATAVDLETLVELLPEYGPRTPSELEGWMREHSGSVRIGEGRAWAAKSSAPAPTEDRRERAELYRHAAIQLLESDLGATRSWLRVLAITGSTAYGEPREGDDCDLMAIVRPGCVWLFLAFTFLRLRLRRNRWPPATEPEWCLNYALDEETAIDEFSYPRGFLFAREALMAHPVTGEMYYRGLLRRGEWLRIEAPRLFARWESTGLPEPISPERASWGERWLNAMLFPAVAAYMQMKGLWVNHRLRRSGGATDTFRTVTQLGRMTLQTQRFQQLSERMAPASRLAPG